MSYEVWQDTERSFRDRLACDLPADKIRWLLRGLALTASEAAKSCPDKAPHVLHEFHECLRLVRDAGVEFLFESWLRNHAAPEIAEAVEREFGEKRGTPTPE